MKKIFLLSLLILYSFNVTSQTQNDVVGFYQLRGGNHYLKPDSTFVILGYGTVITGKWSLKEHGEVNFIQDYSKESFEIYGRHNVELEGSSKLMLSNGLDEEETFIHIGKLNTEHPKLQRVFVKGHRCIKFPEIYTINQTIDTISFSSLPYVDFREKNYIPRIYTYYNTEKFNDFIVYHFKDDSNYPSFSYYYKDGILYYSNRYFGEKQNLNDALNKSNFAQISSTDFTPDFVLYTPKYNLYLKDTNREIFKMNYILDKKRKAYINKLNYKDGEENEEDYDYNNTNLLYIYERMKTFIVFKEDILIEEKSVFKDHCKE